MLTIIKFPSFFSNIAYTKCSQASKQRFILVEETGKPKIIVVAGANPWNYHRRVVWGDSIASPC